MLGFRETNPRVAVDIFMILSGYLMLFQSEVRRADDDPGSFARGFFLRRFFRIAPLYYVVLIFCYTMQGPYLAWATTISAQTEMTRASLSGFTPAHALAHISFLYGLFPRYSVSTLMPDWSLTLEMQFYAVFPLLLLWFRAWSFFWPIVIMFAASFALTQWLIPDFTFPTVLPMKLPLFLAGVLLAWAKWKTSSGAVRIVCLAPVMLILGQKDRMLAVMVMTVLLCDFGESANVPGLEKLRIALIRILSCGPLRKLADWSYGIYLIHPLILLPLLSFFATHSMLATQSFEVRFLCVGGALFLLTTFAASLLHHGIEIPGIRLGRWMESREKSRR